MGQDESQVLLQVTNVFVPAVGDRDANDLRQNSSALFPPEFYVDYLHTPAIQTKIGAQTRYQECPDAPFNLFVSTGDVSGLFLKPPTMSEILSAMWSLLYRMQGRYFPSLELWQTRG